jgi:hypothetical protein
MFYACGELHPAASSRRPPSSHHKKDERLYKQPIVSIKKTRINCTVPVKTSNLLLFQHQPCQLFRPLVIGIVLETVQRLVQSNRLPRFIVRWVTRRSKQQLYKLHNYNNDPDKSIMARDGQLIRPIHLAFAVVIGWFLARTANMQLSTVPVQPLVQQEQAIFSQPQQQPQHQPQHQHCESTMDELEATFDERRLLRTLRVNITHRTPRECCMFDLFEPEAVCFTDERFGQTTRYDAFGDGPKFACGIDYLRSVTSASNGTSTSVTRPASPGKPAHYQDGCLVYSVGSNNQIQFEQAIKKFLPDCETHTFDPTLRKPYVGSAYSEFHPWGIGGANYTFKGITFHTKHIMTIIKDLGHVGRRLDILKIDCEGCEGTAMVPLFEAIARKEIQVDQILIELHNKVEFGATPDIRWKLLREFFDAADRAKMRIYHKERNQWGCKGMECVEYSFVSEDFLRRANAQVVCGKDRQ